MPAKPAQITILNRSYAKVAGQPLFITAELRNQLKQRKRRDGSNGYDSLITRGFRGGKHLIETIGNEFGSDYQIVLSHLPSKISGSRIEVNYNRYLEVGQNRFFEMYRQTGINASFAFLNEAFPERFPKTHSDQLPPTRDVRKVLTSLPEAADAVPKKDRQQLPAQIAELVERQGPDFVFDLLSSLDGAIPRGQARIGEVFKRVVSRLSQEPVKALDELSDLMEQWNLLQLTSLMNVLQGRLATIDTFETLILDDQTYELKTDKSVHRTLERSMWLLNDEYWIAQSNKALRTVIGKQLEKDDKTYEKRRPDFACVDASGKTVLVEIKRPSLELGKDEIDQAELYMRIVRKHTSQRKTPTVYLIGRQISDEAHELAEMRGYPSLMTYQDMIEQARRRYQEYLRVIEGG
jgi:hypothetical protein